MKKALIFIFIFGMFLPVSAFALFEVSLRSGSRGEAVVELQNFLNTQGVFSGKVDGKFGPITRRAVVAFQLGNGLKGDGLFGPLSRAKANSLTTAMPVVPPVLEIPVTDVLLSTDKLVLMPTDSTTLEPPILIPGTSTYRRSGSRRTEKRLGSFTLLNNSPLESVKVTGLTVTLSNTSSPANVTWVKASVDVSLAPKAKHIIDVYADSSLNTGATFTIKLEATLSGPATNVSTLQNSNE